LFGPQPRTSTYVCIWEISLGDVKGVVSALDIRVALSAFDAFSINYRDYLNSPAAEFAVPLDPDGTT